MNKITKELIDDYVKVCTELAVYKNRERQVLDLLWTAEINDAKEYERYGGKYSESIDRTTIKTSLIRNIYGIMPCPEAIKIYKSVVKEEEDAC